MAPAPGVVDRGDHGSGFGGRSRGTGVGSRLLLHVDRHATAERGVVTANSFVNCNDFTSGINLSLFLYRDGVLVDDALTGGTLGAGAIVAETCRPGTYQATAWATIWYPPGNIPGSETINRTSGAIYYNCVPTVVVANPGAQTTLFPDSVSLQMTASGGTGPYTWSATGCPPAVDQLQHRPDQRSAHRPGALFGHGDRDRRQRRQPRPHHVLLAGPAGRLSNLLTAEHRRSGGPSDARPATVSPPHGTLDLAADVPTSGHGSAARTWRQETDGGQRCLRHSSQLANPTGGSSMGSLPSSSPGVGMSMLAAHSASSSSDMGHVVCGASAWR
jgi:hypothetical protein